MMRSTALILPVLALATACQDFLGAPQDNSAGVRVVYRRSLPVAFQHTRPATDGTRLFGAGQLGELVAVDAATGSLLWKREAQSEFDVLGTPVSDGVRVYAAGDSARAFDPATGNTLWQTEILSTANGHYGDVRDGVYFIGTDTSVYALDAATGALRWRRGIGENLAGPTRIRSLVAAEDGVYLCATWSLDEPGHRRVAHVLRMDRSTGDIAWRTVLASPREWNSCVGEPVPDGNLVFVPDAAENAIVALDRATGASQWKYVGLGAAFGPFAPPSTSGSRVIGASMDGLVFALDRTSGDTLWTYTGPASMRDARACGRVVLAHAFEPVVLDPATGRVLATSFGESEQADDYSSRFLVVGRDAYVFTVQGVAKLRCPA